MVADGWIKVWRKLAESDIWLEKPFSKGQAWIDLLLLATSSDHVSSYKGRNKKYSAGTVHMSLCFLSERWGWSRNKVYRFIRKLENDKMLVYQGRTSNGTTDRTQNGTTDGTTSDTVIIVVNWALYQSKQNKNGTTNGTTDGTSKRTSNGTHPKNDIYPKNEISKERRDGVTNTQTDSEPRPGTVALIRPEIDFAGFPSAEDMPSQADGTKRDIPQRVRHLFYDYDAYWRYRHEVHDD